MKAKPYKSPSVSVILPIRNEAESMVGCVESLLQQTYPPDLTEILIVDGMSEDDTKAILSRIIRKAPGRAIRILDNPKKSVSPALNIGIRAATANVIIRMDGHTIPDRTYVSCCVKALSNTEAANVGGLIRPIGDNPFGRAVASAQRHPLGAGGAKFHQAETPGFVDTVYMGAFQKEIFSRTGLFDESMIRNQDYEMNIRIRKAGGRIYLDPAITSTYIPRNTPYKLWKQYFEYGWWKVETLRRHPGSLLWRQFIPVAFVSTLLALSALSFVGWGRMLLACQLLVYLGAVGYTSWRLPRDDQGGILPKLSFALALMIMHFSWGCGFLFNIISSSRFPYRASSPYVPELS